MPKFSQRSMDRLYTCHPQIIELMEEGIKHFDFTVLEGHRGEEAQNQAYDEGKSQVRFPLSKHNRNPSCAIDIAPYPIVWTELRPFYYLGGFIRGLAIQMNIPIRWGGDWNGNFKVGDQGFIDLPHYELILE